MFEDSDTKKDIAIKILDDELGITSMYPEKI